MQASQQTNGVSKSPTSTIQKEVELAMLVLRKLGCLVDTTSDGTGLWVFSNEQSFSSLNSVNAVLDDTTMNEIIVETVTLYSLSSTTKFCRPLYTDTNTRYCYWRSASGRDCPKTVI